MVWHRKSVQAVGFISILLYGCKGTFAGAESDFHPGESHLRDQCIGSGLQK